MAEKSAKEQAEYLKGMRSYSNAVVKEMQAMDGLSASTSKKMEDILYSMKGQSSAADALAAIQAKREQFIVTERAMGREISADALKRLDLEEKLLKKKSEQEELETSIKDVGKDIAKDMAGLVGISGELAKALMTASIAVIAMVIIKEIAQAFVGMATAAKETSLSMGITGTAAMKLQGQVKGAQMSMEGLLLGGDKLNTAMTNIVETTGRMEIPDGMITDVAALSEYLDPKNAVSLARTLENAGQNTKELRGYAEDYAESVGGRGADGLAYLASNQLALVGLSEDQLKVKIQEGIQLKQMGADMDHLNQKAGEALDIESSLRNEMKLRAITGKEISMNALRAAQVSGDTKKIAEEEAKLIAQLGPQLKGNLQLQRMIGDATGLSKDQMLNYQNATAEQAKEASSGSKAIEQTNMALEFLKGNWIQITLGIIGAVGAVYLFKKVMSMMGGKSSKKQNPVAKFVGDFGSSKVLKGAAAMLLVAASMFVMAMAISKMPTDPAPYLGMAVGLGLMLGALYLLAKFPTADLLKGALALAVVGVSLIPFAYAMNLIGDISIGAILAVAAGILIFTGIIMGLGLVMFSGIGAMIFGAGILALLALGAAMIVLGAGIVIFNKGVSGLGDNISIFVEKMGELIAVAPMMLGAVVPLIMFGIALMPFALGLTMATLPMLAFGLAMIPFVAGMTLLSGVMPVFVESVAKLGEQVPNLIAIGAGFSVLAASFLLTTAAMIPFFPTFTATTLGMLALVPAMLLTAGATGIWSLSLSSLSDSIQRLMPNLTSFLGVMPMMAAMIMLVPGLIALSASFIMLSASLIALSGGLAIVTLLLPTLFALAFVLPLISSAMGGGDGDDSESGGGDSTSMAEVVEEIKGLRQDISNQPILINVDGKVVSEITKVQARKLSTRGSYFGGNS